MCVGQVNSNASVPDVARFANEQDQRILIQIMLRYRSSRQIERRLHMSGLRFRQIQQTGILTPRIANRLNSIEGMEIFKANHPRIKKIDRISQWNKDHPFNPESPQFQTFCDYCFDWLERQ